MLDLTGDQAYVSAVVVAEYLPAVILGTVLGHLLDRVPPRSGPGGLRAAGRRRLGADGHDRAEPARSSRSR